LSLLGFSGEFPDREATVSAAPAHFKGSLAAARTDCENPANEVIIPSF
jgi:hypothetical protein